MNINEVVIYLRKSRSDDPSLSVEEVLSRHEAILQEYALNNLGAVVPEEHIFREVVSGETISDRPVMCALMKILESGTYKACLVVEPQRLTRGDLEDCGRVINTFRYTNTLVVTPPKTYNLSDEYDRKFFEMELMRGNDYLEYTKKILKRGREASVKKGNYIGSVAPYGYSKVKCGTGKDSYTSLAIIPEEADAVRLMYHLFVREGYGFAKIAHRLDELGIKPRKSDHWSPAAIKDMLENPVYIGKIRWNWRKTDKAMKDGQIIRTRPKSSESSWILVQGRHEPIIDQITYNYALERRGKNPCVRKSNDLTNPFAGLLYCGTCDKAMSYKKFSQYRGHSANVCESMLCNNQAICHTKSVKYTAFVKRVIELMEQHIKDFEVKLKAEASNSDTLQNTLIKRLELELAKLKQKDMRQKDAYEDGIYTKEEYAVRNAKLQEDIERAKLALNNALNIVPVRIDYQEKISRLTACINALNDESVTAAEKNRLLKCCLEKIYYYNDMESKAGIGRYVFNEFKVELYLKK